MSNKVGFWASDKKCLKINVSELEDHLRVQGFQLIKIDLNAPLEPQGPFAAIIHKLADVMVRAQQSDKLAQKQIQLFEVNTCVMYRKLSIVSHLIGS